MDLARDRDLDMRTCESCGAEKPIREMKLQPDGSTWLCKDCDEALSHSSLRLIGSRAELREQRRLERKYWERARR